MPSHVKILKYHSLTVFGAQPALPRGGEVADLKLGEYAAPESLEVLAVVPRDHGPVNYTCVGRMDCLVALGCLEYRKM